MDDIQLGPIVARREFELRDGGKVVLEVGLPYPVDDGGTYFCPYRIIGLGNERVRRAGGVDSVQALYLGLKMAATDLYASDQSRGKELTWCGQLNLGLPVPEAIADIVPPENE
jgi:hypothetical protein